MRAIKPKDIKRNWHLIDAKEKILGRLSSEVAMHLMGKNKGIYSPNLDTGDFVVVINAQKVALFGKKEKQKKYYRHSGYPGGLYMQTAAQVRKNKPENLIRNAVEGMLPKTKMGKIMLKKLYVFPQSSHPYQSKFKN